MIVHSLVKTFNNDRYKNTKLTSSNRHTPKELGQTEPSNKGSFLSYSLFKASIGYKLYNAWTLNNTTDTISAMMPQGAGLQKSIMPVKTTACTQKKPCNTQRYYQINPFGQCADSILPTQFNLRH